MKSPIKCIGIELEGGWHEDPECIARENLTPEEQALVRVGTDGSVSVPGADWNREVRIGPVPFVKGNWQHIVETMWPDIANKTCGMHMHVSFRNMRHYQLLADSVAFSGYLHEQLWEFQRRNFKFNNSRLAVRLRGENHYCHTNGDTWKQLAGEQDRYKSINWCAFSSHGTLEVRVLPQLSKGAVNKGVAMLAFTARTIEKAIEVELRNFAAQRRAEVLVERV